MNILNPLSEFSRQLYSLFLRIRLHLPRQKCLAFSSSPDARQSSIAAMFVINLDRQPHRWAAVRRELDRILDSDHVPLSKMIIRHSACDAQRFSSKSFCTSDIEPYYNLGDQLFVEPQPRTIPDKFDLERPIRMSQAEIAIARSHIAVWREIALSDARYSLVLEDDVVFARDFGTYVHRAWKEMQSADGGGPAFDMLYLSYKEVKGGAPKELTSGSVFRPERGLWYMSGYVLSRSGAERLLRLLPCRGPVDLWVNHKFGELDVRALRRPVIHQRLDLNSTNSYSILPTLSRIGVIDGGSAALFKRPPNHFPVFAFGTQGIGLSALVNRPGFTGDSIS